MEIEKLLETLRDGSKTTSERKRAYQLLMQNEPLVLEHLLDAFSDPLNKDAYSEVESKRSFENVISRIKNDTIDLPTTSHKKLLYHIFTYTSVAAVIALFFFQIWKKTNNHISDFSSATLHTIHSSFDTIHNSSDTTMEIVLDDLSKVKLYPKSAISFTKPFGVYKKDIFLEGNALFTVHKDKQKAFSVFTKGIEICDLGTVFFVQNSPASVDVQLLKGSVFVRRISENSKMKTIYLQPGEVMRVDLHSDNYILQSPKANDDNNRNLVKINTRKDRVNIDLTSFKLLRPMEWKNAPVGTILDSLTSITGLHFSASSDSINNLSFTGNFLPNTNVQKCLDILSKVCNLSYYQNSREGLILLKHKD
ncbi:MULTISPECIES: FecR family protein [Chitinophagaceae]